MEKYDFECVICSKVLESVLPESREYYQPYRGGELRLVFGYGSFKFDKHIGTTEYRGVICDECSEKIVHKMDMIGYGMDGGKL